MKGFIKLICCSVLIAGVCGCSKWPYSGHSIKARVIDGTNGQPLNGVMVVAYWRTITNSYTPGMYMDGGGPAPTCVRLANLLAATSEADGVFLVPSWSANGCFTMYGSQPELILYKPGYKALRLLNADEDVDPTENIDYQFRNGGTVFTSSTSRWDEATIKLTPDSDRLSDLRKYMDALMAALEQAHPSRCFWSEARPAFLLALQEERSVGMPYGAPSSPGDHSVEDVLRTSYNPKFYEVGDSTCGPVEPYVRSLLNEVDRTPTQSKGH